jgi:cell division septum initiation protein DivIVA
MDLASRIQQLEDIVKEAKSMPLSSSALLNREELLELVASRREQLPDEVKQARWVVRDREELLAKARREAESLVEKARAEQARLVSHEAVVEAAQEEAERIVSDARDQAHQVRMEGDDYVDAKLAQFEIAVQRLQELLVQTHETLAGNVAKVQSALADQLQQTQGALSRVSEQVTKGRTQLAGTHPAQELAPEEESFIEAEPLEEQEETAP